MFSLTYVGGSIRRVGRGCKHLFWQSDQEDIEICMEKDDDDISNSRGKEPIADGNHIDEDTNDMIEPGQRSSRWFDRMEQISEDNRKRSIENQKLLMRMDFRTVWIARILTALLAALGAGLFLQFFGL